MAFSRRVHSLSSGYAGQRASSDSERTAAAREEADVEDAALAVGCGSRAGTPKSKVRSTYAKMPAL